MVVVDDDAPGALGLNGFFFLPNKDEVSSSFQPCPEGGGLEVCMARQVTTMAATRTNKPAPT